MPHPEGTSHAQGRQHGCCHLGYVFPVLACTAGEAAGRCNACSSNGGLVPALPERGTMARATSGGRPARRAMPAVVSMEKSADPPVALMISAPCRAMMGHCSYTCTRRGPCGASSAGLARRQKAKRGPAHGIAHRGAAQRACKAPASGGSP